MTVLVNLILQLIEFRLKCLSKCEEMLFLQMWSVTGATVSKCEKSFLNDEHSEETWAGFTPHHTPNSNLLPIADLL